MANDHKTKPPTEKTPMIVIGARHLPTYYGGLSQYQRSLADHLSSSHGISGMMLAEGLAPGQQLPEPQIANWKFFHFDARKGWQNKRKWLMRLLSKPKFHPLAEKIIVNHWARAINEKLPRDVEAIHFVGTGWDMFGFALLHVARQRAVHFTIWPAVHPGDWGDDLIDIRLYNEAHRVFAQSDNEKAWLTKKGVPAEKIVRCGLPPMCLTNGDATGFRSRYGLADRPLVLFMGRKDEGKGYPALLEAWKEVRNRFPDVCLLAIGPQNPPGNYPIGEEKDGVLDLGIVSEQDKADALAACDIFCLPSAHESFGIVYLEAWFYAKPVVCGTAPACRELIEQGVDGIWSSQEPKQLADDLSQLLSNPHEAKEMGLRGQRKQQANYTWDTVGKIHLKEFLP